MAIVPQFTPKAETVLEKKDKEEMVMQRKMMEEVVLCLRRFLILSFTLFLAAFKEKNE